MALLLNVGLAMGKALGPIGLVAEDVVPAIFTGGASLPWTLGGQALGALGGGLAGGWKGAGLGANLGGAAGSLGYGGYNAFTGAPSTAGAGTTNVAGGVNSTGGAFQEGITGAAQGGAAPNYAAGVAQPQAIPEPSLASAGGGANPPTFSQPDDLGFTNRLSKEAMAGLYSNISPSVGSAVGGASGITSGLDTFGKESPSAQPSLSVPGTDLSTGGGGGNILSKLDPQKAMMALQALSTARGFLPQAGQVQDPNAMLMGMEQAQQQEQQRALQALISRETPNLYAQGLSGMDPQMIQMLIQMQQGGNA